MLGVLGVGTSGSLPSVARGHLWIINSAILVPLLLA
jgi:hypothetical protein